MCALLETFSSQAQRTQVKYSSLYMIVLFYFATFTRYPITQKRISKDIKYKKGETPCRCSTSITLSYIILLLGIIHQLFSS